MKKDQESQEKPEKPLEKVSFLKRKNIVFSVKRYGVDALGAMALGLFSSLIVGLILKVIGQQLGAQFLIDFGMKAMAMMGPAIGCLLYTSDAADEEDSVDLGGRRIIKKKKRDK